MNGMLIGHDWATALLEKHLRGGALRHAYLFIGPAGIGKRTLATWLAQSLMCAEPEGGPCGECRGCRLVHGEQHPDLHVVRVEPDETTIKVEQIRELQRRIALSPYEAERRVVLLLGANEMSTGASNALLKTLEEPPADCVLLLTAEARESLLPTIVSRCETLALRPVAHDELVAGLRARLDDPTRAQMLAGLAGGRPGVALRLARDDGELERRQEHVADLLQVLQSNRRQRFAFADAKTPRKDPAEVRAQVQEMLETWLAVLRAVMLRAHGVGSNVGGASHGLVDAESLAGGVGTEEAAQATRAVERALVGLQWNANLKLTLEMVLLKLPYLEGASGAIRPAN